MHPSPFVKWAGGKTQLIAQYEPYFPSTFGRYIEPFVGGGALFFYLYRKGRLAGRPAILLDNLEELINCYQVIRNQVEMLLKELKTHDNRKLNSDYFYEVRDWDRQPGYAQRSAVQRAARFIFLNHTCYNGLYRVNRRGQFNVPVGRHRNPTIRNVQNLRAVGDALQGVSLLVDDFERCLELARPGDFVYLDPPYQPLSDTASFTSYTSTDFGAGDQQRLAVLFRQLDHLGCQVMLSNSSTDLIRELYDGYDQIPVHATRAISSRGDGRGAVPELLVVNRYERL
jgi:DNA adenine methylase